MATLCRRAPNYSSHEIKVERATGFEPVRTSLAKTSRAKLKPAWWGAAQVLPLLWSPVTAESAYLGGDTKA